VIIRTVPNALAGLLGRLTDPQDRETYAALISFVGSLPEGDELFRIVELLGLLSLVGQRVPDALAEFLAELRAQTKVAETYRAQVDARLAILPQEIAAGIDPAAITREMSERFRQQLRDTGLRETSALLASSAKDIRALSGEIAAAVKPATHEYRSIASAISNETTKLITAARRIEQHNEQLIVRQRSNSWMLTATADNGKLVTRLSIATHKRFRTESGEWETKTQWHACVIYGGKSVDYAAKIPAGALVFVEGEMSYCEHEREIQGLTVQWPIAEIVVSSISAISRRHKTEAGAAA
jgi:single-strand DNA-binding protein